MTSPWKNKDWDEKIAIRNATKVPKEKGYDLELMSNLPYYDENKAIAGKIYLSSDSYVVLSDLDGKGQSGSLKDSRIDLSGDLSNRLNDEDLKKCILDVTSKANHTQQKKTVLWREQLVSSISIFNKKHQEQPTKNSCQINKIDSRPC